MKKILKIAGVIVGILLVAMIITPFLFKDKIKEAVIRTANNKLNAQLTIDDFGLNLFSNFPDATLSLDNISISGIDDFEGDTLLKAKSVSVTINLSSLLGDRYEISKIKLGEANLYAKLLQDGRTNYDIVKDTTSSSDGSSSFKLSLQKVTLENCKIIYTDQQSNMKVLLSGWNGTLSGDFTSDETILNTQSVIDEISFTMDGIPYLYKIKGLADAKLKANLKTMTFTFEESDLQLNEVKASIDGSLTVGENDTDFDLKLNAPDTQFKDILSILPSMYTDDFRDIKTSGTASLDGFIKGKMDKETYPAFNFNLSVKDAMFQYPSLPKLVNNINIAMSINNKGGSLDNMVIDISKFTFTMGGNPFSASINISTPMSDPNLKVHLNGKIDLGMIKEVYPLESGTELNGKLTANLNIATRMSYIEREQYDNVTASGKLSVTDMTYKSDGMQDVKINDIILDFSPKYVNLESLNLKIGQNDLSANGRLENFIAYALKDQTLKGQLNIKSNYFNIDNFTGSESSTNTDDTSNDAFIVPKNIDFSLSANMQKVIYENIELTNLNGGLYVKNGVITLNNIAANTLGGSAKMTGSYSTAENSLKPKVDFTLSLIKVSFTETFKSVEAVQKFAPVFEKIAGNYSMNLKFNTTLGESLLQILGALTGEGLIQTDEVKIEGVEVLDKLASSLNLGTNATKLKSFTTKNLNVPFKIENGNVITKPFNINIGSTGKINLEGTTSLNESINYKGTVTLPESMSNSLINNVGLTITGTFRNPVVSIDTKSMIGEAANSISKEVLGGTIEEKKDEVNARLTEEKKKQAQKLRDEAQAASDKLVKTAEEQSEKLVNEAKNPIAKVAAQTAAKKLVEEAKKQGQKLIDQAEIQAQKLEAEASTTE